MGARGARAAPFIGPRGVLGVRATPEISGAPGSIRTWDRVPVHHEVGDDPDERALPSSEMREEWGRPGWAGTGNGPAVWAAGEGKEKGEEGDFGPWERKEKEGRRGKRWAGWAERERGKRKAFQFLKGFEHIQFKFEFKN